MTYSSSLIGAEVHAIIVPVKREKPHCLTVTNFDPRDQVPTMHGSDLRIWQQKAIYYVTDYMAKFIKVLHNWKCM